MAGHFPGALELRSYVLREAYNTRRVDTNSRDKVAFFFILLLFPAWSFGLWYWLGYLLLACLLLLMCHDRPRFYAMAYEFSS